MAIDRKIDSLPNWLEEFYGNLKISDNSLLVSDSFTTEQALISNQENGTENLIWPITLQFDLENFHKKQRSNGTNIRKYIWNFGDEEIETFSPKITRLFDEKWNYEISITAIWNDAGGNEIEQIISNTPSVSISHLIEVEETITNNGGKKLSFDANDLNDLWQKVTQNLVTPSGKK